MAALDGVVARLYAALGSADRNTLRQLLALGLVAVMTHSLPFGIGGIHAGADAMFDEVWGPTMAAFTLHPEPTEYLQVSHGRVVVFGRYVGVARPTGRDLDAAFVHDLRFRGHKVSQWIQITDSAAWIAAFATVGQAQVASCCVRRGAAEDPSDQGATG